MTTTEVRRVAPVRVTSEPRTYGENRHRDISWFQDLALSWAPTAPGHTRALERLHRHQTEVTGEIRTGSPEGRRAERIARHQAERRDDGVTSVSSAGFTTPQWLTDQWVAYRTPYRTFIDQTVCMPLPEYGLQINIPSLTSGTSVTFAVENTGIDNASPSGAVINQLIITMTGAVTLAQQLYDRGGMDGLTFDRVILEQLKMSVDSQTDNYMLGEVLFGISNAGNTITDNAGFSIANFYADVAKAREAVADSLGTRLKATHIFSTTDIFSYITRQVDSSQRPIVTPDWMAQPWAGLAMRGEAAADGWTGHVLPGTLGWFSDDNMPPGLANNSYTNILVGRPNTVLTLEGDPISFSYPETNANHLSVIVGIRKYLAVGPRFPNAFAVITGSAYPLTAI